MNSVEFKSELEKIKAGDEKALSAFLDTIRHQIRPVIRRMVMPSRHKDLVDDITQDALVRIMQNLNRIAESRNILSSCIAIAKHTCIDYKRKQQVGGNLGHAISEEEIRTTSDIQHNLLVKEIDEHLQAFDQRERTVFWLYYRYGLTAREISPLCGLTEKGVESLLLRMARFVRSKVAEPRKY